MMKAGRLQCVWLALGALFFSCTGERLTPANVDQVTEGMSKKQVESILGPPTSVENQGFHAAQAHHLCLSAIQRHGNGVV
jgi:hypothetical protein